MKVVVTTLKFVLSYNEIIQRILNEYYLHIELNKLLDAHILAKIVGLKILDVVQNIILFTFEIK